MRLLLYNRLNYSKSTTKLKYVDTHRRLRHDGIFSPTHLAQRHESMTSCLLGARKIDFFTAEWLPLRSQRVTGSNPIWAQHLRFDFSIHRYILIDTIFLLWKNPKRGRGIGFNELLAWQRVTDTSKTNRNLIIVSSRGSNQPPAS